MVFPITYQIHKQIELEGGFIILLLVTNCMAMKSVFLIIKFLSGCCGCTPHGSLLSFGWVSQRTYQLCYRKRF